MGQSRAARGLLLAIGLVWALASPALALSWQKSSGLPAFNLSQSAYGNACLGCDPRANAVSFSPDGTVGLMTLPLQSPPALYRTLDGGRTWAKISEDAFFGVWVLSNTRWLAVGQLGTSQSTPYDPQQGNLLHVGGPDGTGAVRWTTVIGAPAIPGSVAYRFEVAPFDGGAFVLGDVLYPTLGPGNSVRLEPFDANKNALQVVWRYDLSSNPPIEVRRNAWSLLRPGFGSQSTRNRTPFIQRIGAASRNVAWVAWQGWRGETSFDGQVDAWDGTRWTTIRVAQAGVTTLQLVGLAANQLWVMQGTSALYFNGQRWTNYLTGLPGSRSFRRYLPSSATTLSSMVLVQTFTQFVDDEPKVRDDAFRWNAGIGDFTHIATGPYWRASRNGGVVSTTSAASNGRVVLVYSRETVTEFAIPYVAVYGAIWGPDGASQQSIDPVSCIVDDPGNTNKPCTIWSVVALPNGAALLAQNGMYFLA